ARITLLEMRTGADNNLDAWRKATEADNANYYSTVSHTPAGLNGPQVRSLVTPAVTDADGRFTLRGVGEGRIARILIEGPGIETKRVFARTEAGHSIEIARERRRPDLGNYTYHPAEFIHVAG